MVSAGRRRGNGSPAGITKASPGTASPLDQVPLLRAFSKIGFEPLGSYLYTFSFADIGPNLIGTAIGQLEKFTTPKIRVVPGINAGPGSLLERDVVREMKPGGVKSASKDVQGLKDIIKLKAGFLKWTLRKNA